VFEILDHLPPVARVLDLGCQDGSFAAESYLFQTVRVDLTKGNTSRQIVVADAAQLPFRSRIFDAVILNHCLEHFVRLKPSLQEIGRIVKSNGAIFVSVPDARTLSDRLYRKVAKKSGGHVNLFDSHDELIKMLAWYFGLPYVGTRTLHSSLTFLNRRNLKADPAIRSQMKFNGLCEPLLALVNAFLRLVDRALGARLSVYGWGVYFGTVSERIDPTAMINVCLRCGKARTFAEILGADPHERHRFWVRYRCDCGAINIGVSELTMPR